MLGFGSQKRAGIQNMLYKQKKPELCWRSSLVTVTLHNRMLIIAIEAQENLLRPPLAQ